MQTIGPVGCVRILGYKKLIVAETNGIYEFDFNSLTSLTTLSLQSLLLVLDRSV
jgi:hypothetical protein